MPTLQPELSSTNFSPKASLSYDPNKDWNITANFGEAYRYPTVTELYQNVAVSGVAVFANPLLTPEQDFTGELNIERHWSDGRVRLTLFGERTNNAIISQTNHCDECQQRPDGGDDLQQCRGDPDAGRRTVGRKGQCADHGPATVRQRDLCRFPYSVRSDLGGHQSADRAPDTVVGKRVPYVPDWRARLGVTYRPNENWAFTVAARYSGKQYSTLDNTDIFLTSTAPSTTSSWST